MKIQPHCEMISKQFLLASQKSDQPNKIDFNPPAPSTANKAILNL